MGFGISLGNGLAVNLSTGKLGFGIGIGDSPFAWTFGKPSLDIEASTYEGTTRSETAKVLGDVPSQKPTVHEVGARRTSPLELRLGEARLAAAGPRARDRARDDGPRPAAAEPRGGE